MNYDHYLDKYTSSLANKNVIVTGASGGLGKDICFFLAHLNANIILVSRNINRLNSLKEEILRINNKINVAIYTCDFTDIESVKECVNKLNKININYLINNAGAYHIPNKTTSLGYNNVFQINFITPFYLTKRLLPNLEKNNGKVINVNSIAHNFTKLDKNNIEFINHKPINIYANSKRYFLFSMKELFKDSNVKLATVHPGISFTNILSNYPLLIQKIIKYPMKLIFISPKKASLNVIRGIFIDTGINKWIGPKFFNIWGKPSLKELKTKEDSDFIYQVANNIYQKIEQAKSE